MRIFLIIFLLCLLSSQLQAADGTTPLQHKLQPFVDAEQSRIENNYNADSPNFHAHIDQLQQRFDSLDNWMPCLLDVLRTVNGNDADEKLASGEYDEMLEFLLALEYYEGLGQLQDFLLSDVTPNLGMLPAYRSHPAAKDFLLEAARLQPDEVFRQAAAFKSQPYALAVLEEAALQAPLSAKRYLSSSNTISSYLELSKVPAVTALFNIYNKHGFVSKAYVFAEPIAKGKMDMNTVRELEGEAYYHHLSIALMDSTYQHGEYSLMRELYYLSTDYLRSIGYRLNQGYKENAYADIQGMSADELLLMMIAAPRELSGPSYGGLMQRIDEQSDSISASSLSRIPSDYMLAFLRTTEGLGYMDTLMALLEPKLQINCLALMTQDNYEYNYDFSQLLTAAPATPTVSENSSTNEDAVQIEVPAFPGDNNSPKDAAAPIEYITISLPEEYKQQLLLKRDIDHNLKNIPAFIEQPYAQDILFYAADESPDELFKNVKGFQHKFWSSPILVEAAKAAPLSAKKYLAADNHIINLILQRSSDTAIITLYDMYAVLGSKSRAYILLNDVVNGKLSIEEAGEISDNPSALFRAMIAVADQPSHLGAYSIESELNYEALKFVRSINDLEGQSSSTQFASISDFTAEEMYALLIYGQEEVFQSSFQGIYSRLSSKLKTDSYSFLEGMGFNHYRTFIKLCAEFGMLDHFLSRMPADKETELLSMFASGLELETENLQEIVNVADAMGSITDISSLKTLQQTIKQEFERVSEADDATGTAIYGLLITLIDGDAVYDPSWYEYTAQRFAIEKIDRIANENLFEDDYSIMQMYFYNDDDGIRSFANFMNYFKGAFGWKVEEESSYVRIYSTAGEHVELFANRPEYEYNGPKDIGDALAARGLAPQVVIHRGHSFHTEKTLSRVPESCKLLFVGSCGGYYKVPIALELVPDVHVIATKQIGTMQINDPMVKALCDDIRNGNDIVWPDFWNKMEKQLGSNSLFYDYVPPHQNLGALFIQAYYKLLGIS